MVAIGTLTHFVRTSGDTMTGNLVMSGGADIDAQDDVTVGDVLSAHYQGIPQSDVMRLLSTAVSTGVVSGGEFNPNANPALIDITAMTGWIVNYNSSAPISATNPQLTYVSTPAFTGITPTFGQPTGVSWYLVNSAGTLLQQATRPTATQRRTHIVLGATAQVGGVIVEDQTLPVIQSQPLNQLMDLMEGLGNFRISGAVLSPNGANLNINLTSGVLFARAFNQIPGFNDPHTAPLSAQTPMQFRHVVGAAGMGGALTTTLDVGNYNPGGAGVISPVPGGANVATNFRIWGFGTNLAANQILVQYGQNTYPTLTDAQAAIGATAFTVNPTAAAAGVLLGWISVIHTATALNNTAQAIFVPTAGKFSTP